MALTIKGLEQDVYYMNNNIFVELEETEDFDMFLLTINGSIAYRLLSINNKLRLNLSAYVKSYLGILNHDNDVKNVSILFQSVKISNIVYPEALVFTANGGLQKITGSVNVFDDSENPLDATHWRFEYKLMTDVNWRSYQMPYIPFQSSFYEVPDVIPSGNYSIRVMLIGAGSKKGIWKQIDNVIVT